MHFKATEDGAVDQVGVIAEQGGGEAASGAVGGAAELAASVVVGGAVHKIAEKVKGIAGEPDLPIFEEKAITSSIKKAAGSLPGGVGGVVGGVLAGLRGQLGEKHVELNVASGDALDVRNFSVTERISDLFQINLVAVSDNPSVDFDEVVGRPARFTLRHGAHERFWSGICSHLEQVRVESSGLSTYQISIVPTLWLLTQRRNYRMHQQISELDIVLKMLEEWNIKPVERVDKGAYKKRKYRIQYAETDFAFMSRMLEDAGISYYFEQVEDETKMVLSDAPQGNPRRGRPLVFVDDTSMVRDPTIDFATAVRMRQRVRPGKYTMGDHDYRRPAGYKLMKTATGGRGIEERLEQYHYRPGAFLYGTDQGDPTPVADDKGRARTDEKEGELLAQRRLDAERGSARVCTFQTSAYDLAPGVVMSMVGHQHAALGEGRTFLIVESSIHGADQGEWSHYCEARGTDVPFRPEVVTPRPTVNGVESATVVGPPGEEIHTDEFGRVRVHFHWNLESKMDDNSSCWIHVSQPWGGSGYGGTNLPRVGQEVLVDFLGGDPDRPVIVGRVYTNLQKTPYKLPENKTQSGWKSESSPGGGGFNEIRFEDKKGNEQVYIQAERDLTRLTKHNESVTIRNDLTKLVGGNEREVTSHNRSVVVGINRATQVGQIDSTIVGDTHLVMISPPGEGGGEASSFLRLKDKKIVLTTGAGATITLSKDTITLNAGTIRMTTKRRIVAVGKTGIGLSSRKNNISLKSKSVTLAASAGDVKITGGPMVKINAPGMPAGRLLDLAPAFIAQGSPTVVIGLSPPGFPLSPTYKPKPGEDPRVTAMRTLLQTSPTGLHALETFDKYGVKVAFAKGTGSFYNPSTNTMTLDTDESLTEQSLTFVHEMNHAEYKNAGMTADAGKLDKNGYVDGMIAEESKGTVAGIEAQQELEANGYDVGNQTFPLQGQYEAAYQKEKIDYLSKHPGASASEVEAAAKKAGYDAVVDGFNTGAVVTSNTGEKYPDYYGKYWDQVHGGGP